MSAGRDVPGTFLAAMGATMAFLDIFSPVSVHPARRRRIPSLGAMLGLARQRHALARLDPHLRADIGVSFEAAMDEASRPPWDMPTSNTWRG